MIENTPEDRRAIADEVNGKRSKSGKTLYPQWIDSEDELIEQYKEYCRRDLLSRYPKPKGAEQKRQYDALADIYADLSAKHFRHDLPALILLFKRYLTQR